MQNGLRLLITALALHIAPAVALADACEDARNRYDESDKAPVTRSIESVTRFMFTSDPAERQKIACENERIRLEISENGVRYHQRVDRACGKRIRWKTCDTACAIREVQKQKKKVAYECDPKRVAEAIENDRLEKEERDRKAKADQAEDNARLEREMPLMMACGKLQSFWRSRSTDKEWTGWVKQCSEAPRDYCVRAWISLEKERLPTAGLSCRPTAEERAESKRLDEWMESPERKNAMACSDLVAFASMPQKGEPDTADLKMCGESDECETYKSIIEEKLKRPFSALICTKSK